MDAIIQAAAKSSVPGVSSTFFAQSLKSQQKLVEAKKITEEQAIKHAEDLIKFRSYATAYHDLKKLYTRPTMSDKELRSRTANHVGLQMPMEGEALAEHNRKKVEKKQAAIEKAALASSQSIGVPEE